ncbi:DNA-binding FadR family transcriptional regulator [Microbacterium ulmi]|uniref:FadR/GntR family transcriptional regulator n=1 Tax=Microbacterium ulmi TaxID=179095 RepID=UPI0031333661|nr:DNA-binding FadR family transcriptional regulator [Microbacterium ulmi]
MEIVVDKVLDKIVSGEVGPHEALPSETEIASESDVSRLTAREAMKTLEANNVVYKRQGLGTFVNPVERWTDLEAIARVALRNVTREKVPLHLIEVRQIVEVGAAELAAVNHRPDDLIAMQECIATMQAAHESGDIDAFSQADIAFHDAILRATGNPFIPALLAQLTVLLRTVRRVTSDSAEVQTHAIRQHELVLEAIRAGVPARAHKAMNDHMVQTVEDYETYFSKAFDRVV